MRPELRKFTFSKMGETLKKFLAGNQCQYRIPQELQLLIVPDFVLIPRLLRFLLASLRTMRDGLFYDGTTAEMVAQALFQRRNFPFLHKKNVYTAALGRLRAQLLSSLC